MILIANCVGGNGDNSDFSGGHYEDGNQSWNDYARGGDVVQRRQKALRHHLTKCSSRMCQSFTKRGFVPSNATKNIRIGISCRNHIGSPP